jgi:PAS domain S-box-containing protein
MIKTFYVKLAIIFILMVSGCGRASAPVDLEKAPFASFKDIPGVTAQEIAAIETLRQKHAHFVYGMNYNTVEAFPVNAGQNGISDIGGYTAHLCKWLTALFDIPFRPAFYDWNTLVSGLANHEIDFTGDLTLSDERKKTHFMTSTIAERTLSTFKIADKPSITEIAKSRSPRLVFVSGSAILDYVREATDYAFEPVFAGTHAEAYRIIKSGDADAFLTMNIVEPDFDIYGDVIIETFYPLMFGSAALTTQNPDLKPVISVVQKALENGGVRHLAELYTLGQNDYIRNKFFESLEPEEREYIQNNPVVKVATETDSYPLSFYNRNDDELQGIAFDVMRELKLITGLSFEIANPMNTSFLELTDMVESGKASMITAMMRSRERERRFLLPKTTVMQEFPILVSKSEFPNVQFNELSNVTVGIVRGTLHAELFKRWFPNNRTYREYDNLDGAFNALVHGDVDMFMAMSNYLLSLMNYKELVGYKANIKFDNNFDITFGFNKNEDILYSIIDKAMKLIDLENISDYWMHKTYDYRAKVAEGRLPWLICAAVLALIILTMILRSRNIQRQKEADAQVHEADERTQLMLEQTPLVVMLWDKDANIIECNQEAVRVTGLSSKQEYMKRLFDLTPDLPDGTTSSQAAQKAIAYCLKTGYIRIPWALHHAVTGELIPFDVTIAKVKYKGEDAAISYAQDVRERNAAIEKMREADDRARVMIEQAPLVVMLWDKDANILDCNQEALGILGLSSKEEYMERFFEIAPKQLNGMTSKEAAKMLITKVLETGYERVEWILNHPVTGEAIPFDSVIARIKYKNEYVVMSYGQDVRELKASTKLVMEKTSMLSAIFDTASDLIFVKDLDSKYIRCNKSFESLMGCSCDNIIGKDDAEGLNAPPEVAAAFVAEDKQIFDKKKMIAFEDYILASDGTKVLFETVKSPLIINDKMAGLVGIARDITQRKATEEELIRQHSLMDTVNMAAAVLLEPDADGGVNAINHSMEIVCQSVDADRVFLWQNIKKDNGSLHYKQVCKWTRAEYAMGDDLPEYSYEEAMPHWKDQLFVGKNINGPLDTLPGYDPEIFSIYAMQSILIVPLFLKGEYWGFVSFDDCRNRRFFPAADEHILRSWGLLVVGATQRAKIMSDLEHAVEEAKRATSQAMKAYAEAENALEAKSRFIANMNHEMRTPMNVIVGLTDLLLEEKDVSEKAKGTLQKVNIAGNTLMGLISDVLDISKAEAGKMDLIPVEYDVASMLNDIIALNAIRAEDKPIVFKLDIDKNLPTSLLGDDLRVKQILNNLLSNAFKYTKKGEVTLGVSCQPGGRRHGDYIWLSFYVNDTGIGIRKDDVKKLFTDYNQVDTRANREIEGTGLGLSITKKFVELMEGEISVESEYGKGSIFRVRIRQGFITDKLIDAKTVESLSSFRYSDERKKTQKKLVRSDLSHAKVLVVDDFPTNLDVAAGMLRKYKMQVDCVMSGQESIDLIAAGEPAYDAIFMDHMMPGMDGVEAAKAIRALGNEYAQNIPIIALTANAVAESEKMFLENGFNAFLPKPFSVMSLDSVVLRWVRKK